ncbi:retrovirus-related pol polyprotein from transposon TNT 1-94 [Tanacetum coccineum]|uniref:Retrovirus-related pol polyprotein from transposon TNT 1-94 n=1 Tax=Tanacetum coccineum TaxID=301880 RepID=A0ABQ4XJR8_9ASTR
MESYYSRFYRMMNEMYQKEVNEIRAERITKNANPLALVAAAQQYPYPYYQAPKSHKSYAPPSKQSSSTRSYASTKYKGKEIAKGITPSSESASEEDSDPEQAQRDKDMQNNLELIAKYFKKIYKPTNNNLITSLNSRNKNVDTSPRYKNDNQTRQFGNQRTVTVAEARETEVSTADSGTDTEPLENIVQLIVFIVDSGCTKHMTGNLKLLSDLYIISLQEMTSLTPICFMAKASPTQAWLWHQRLSHLNFDYINLLSKKDIVIGLPKLKYVKDQLCSSCELSKAKKSSFKTKVVPSLKEWLNLLHMDLCGPMRVESINGKKYILVIVDDYFEYSWTLFLRSKDKTPEVLNDFMKMIQRNLQAQVITVRTDKGIEFLNKTLHAYFKEEGIEHQKTTPRTLKQNGVVER